MSDARQTGDWYIARAGQSHGPVSWDDLLALFRAGQVSATDFVWREGLDDWAALGTLVGPATPPPAPAFPAASHTPASRAPGRSASAPRVPDTERRRRGVPRAFVVVVFGTAILAAGLFGFSLSALVRGPEVSEAKIARSDARSAAPKAAEGHGDSAALPLGIPLSNDAEARPPFSTDRAPAGPEVPSPLGKPTPDESPATLERPKDAASPGQEPSAKSAPPSTGSPSVAAADPPPKQSAPPSTDVPPSAKESPAKEPPTSPTRAAETRTLYQEVLVARRPSFDVSGITISQDLQYRVISKLLVGPRSSDGKIEVKQTIYETKLEKSDGLSRAAFEESLRGMRGQEFHYTLGKENEIVKFTGPKENRKVVKADGLGGEGFLLSSVMDDDGWKELAQLSFFLPPSPLKRGQRFERKLTHDWGALGAWYGKTIFNPLGETAGEQRIDYAHYLHYVVPEKKEKDLPFEVAGATFKIDQASGSIQWNAKAGRISGATERFVVRGVVTTKVLGQSVDAKVEESQAFALRIMDKLPSEKSK